MSKVKQVLVIRKDLKMRRGKEIAQCSHASVSFLSNKIRSKLQGNKANILLSEEELEWFLGSFAKVTLQVNSEEELMQIYTEAIKAGLTTELIIDSGLTEFHGEPTKTCLAIGPHYSDKIDPITSGLKLY